MGIDFYHLTSKGLNIDDIDVTSSSGNIGSYLDQADASISQVDAIRSKYGAMETSLGDSLNDYDEINSTLESAQSDIEDADIATEMTNYSTASIRVKAGISLMSQSNQLPQDCVNLLINSLS
jgi:flagellin